MLLFDLIGADVIIKTFGIFFSTYYDIPIQKKSLSIKYSAHSKS